MGLEVFYATEKDYPVIRKIAYETWPHTFKNILSQEQIKYMLKIMYSQASLSEQVDKKGHKFLLVKDGDDHIGYLSYELNHLGLSKTKIHKIYILPTTQGKGVGKLLMSTVIQIARERDNTMLSLNVNRDNPAIEFYKKIGFKKVGEEDIDIGNGFFMEDAVMEKKLNV